MRLELVIGGVLYAFWSTSLFLVNLLVLSITLKFNEFSSNTYRIIKNMCFACLLQQFVFFIGALMTFCNSNFNAIFEKICGAIVQSAWMLYLSLSLALAIDRMLIFVCSRLAAPVSYFLLSASWLFAFAHLVILSLPGFGWNYCYCDEEGNTVTCIGWDYDYSPGSRDLSDVERYVFIVVECAVLLCYLVVLGCLVKMRLMTNADRKISSFKTEKRILIVSVVSFVYESLLIIFLFYGMKFLPDSDWSDIVVNLFWMMNSGLFSFTTLLINTSMRAKVFSMLQMNSKVTFVTSFHS